MDDKWFMKRWERVEERSRERWVEESHGGEERHGGEK